MGNAQWSKNPEKVVFLNIFATFFQKIVYWFSFVLKVDFEVVEKKGPNDHFFGIFSHCASAM